MVEFLVSLLFCAENPSEVRHIFSKNIPSYADSGYSTSMKILRIDATVDGD
jgi:hypothetical protein